MTDQRHRDGRAGEQLAAEHLAAGGYRLLDRNYRCSLGELDLVAERKGELVFVEVRTKRQPCLFRPEESISRDKALRLMRLAEYYMAATGQEDRPWRIDVVAVELRPDGSKARLEHFANATAAMELE
ncbi:MAG TPA: YraN family protein [Chloroflexota bacterium]|nr:YraN family protein [Chloroflexota bacterium]